MTNTKNPAVLLSLILGCIVLLFSETGCNTDNSAYVIRLDSLDQKLDLTEEYLRIDYATISAREAIITKQIDYIKEYYDMEISEEFGNSMTRYRGVKKAYSNFLKQYPKAFDELKSLQKQANDLRTSVTKNELTKEEFKTFYKKEMFDTDQNLKFAEGLSKTIHSLEPEYQRISNIVHAELTRIAQTNEGLADRMKADESN